MPKLFHVSDLGPFAALHPRPSPPGTEHTGRPLVWAVDEVHLPNYLLPRECPRVCWTGADGHPLLGSPADRVIALEAGWLPTLTGAGLTVHELATTGFDVLDEGAGYWVAEREVAVLATRAVDDCLQELAERGVEVRLTVTLWPYVDAVVQHAREFSAIRMRNALPRRGVQPSGKVQPAEES